jgi:hypothetical protein
MDKLMIMVLRRTYELDRLMSLETNLIFSEGHLTWWTKKDYSIDFCYVYLKNTVMHDFNWDLVRETNGNFYPNREIDIFISEYIDTKYYNLIIEKFKQFLKEESHS